METDRVNQCALKNDERKNGMQNETQKISTLSQYLVDVESSLNIFRKGVASAFENAARTINDIKTVSEFKTTDVSAADMQNEDEYSHINSDRRFQSDKYPNCPAGKVPLSTDDPDAQDLLWDYAQRRRKVDPDFSRDLEKCVVNDGFVPPDLNFADIAVCKTCLRYNRVVLMVDSECERCRHTRQHDVYAPSRVPPIGMHDKTHKMSNRLNESITMYAKLCGEMSGPLYDLVKEVEQNRTAIRTLTELLAYCIIPSSVTDLLNELDHPGSKNG